MKVYRRFLVVLTGVILAAAIMIAALVIYVDPFFQYHKPLAGFSYAHKKTDSHDGMNRFLIVLFNIE